MTKVPFGIYLKKGLPKAAGSVRGSLVHRSERLKTFLGSAPAKGRQKNCLTERPQ